MTKYGLRILVGLIAFVLGLCAVWLLVSEVKFKTYRNETSIFNTEIKTDQNPAIPTGKLEVRFIGYGKIEKRPTLNFKVINHNPNPAKYWASQKEKPEIFVKFNNKEIEKRWTGGCEFKGEYILKSEESFEMEVFADTLVYELLKEKRSFELGFSDSFENQIWSEPMTISEKIKQDIIKNVPKFLKQNNNKMRE